MLPFCLHLLLVASGVAAGENSTVTSPIGNITAAAADGGGMSNGGKWLTGCGVVFVCVILIFVFVRYTRLGRQFAGKWCIH